MKEPKFQLDETTEVQPPFLFKDWLSENDKEIQSKAEKWVYGKEMQTGVCGIRFQFCMP